ncbi:Hsp70 family protein, partial [Streptococcus danieliae]|nr:Hsp70 family protein [Streptococcus danieliae]
FDIDKNGIVNVTAKDLGTQKEQKITIESSSSLSDADIDRMVKEAEANAEADAKRKEEADLRNEADQLSFQADKALEDGKDKVDQSLLDAIKTKNNTLKEAIKNNELEGIKSAKEELEKAVQEMTMKLYEQAQAAGSANSEAETTSSNDKDDDVVEADFTE